MCPTFFTVYKVMYNTIILCHITKHMLLNRIVKSRLQQKIEYKELYMTRRPINTFQIVEQYAIEYRIIVVKSD